MQADSLSSLYKSYLELPTPIFSHCVLHKKRKTKIYKEGEHTKVDWKSLQELNPAQRNVATKNSKSERNCLHQEKKHTNYLIVSLKHTKINIMQY